MSHDVFISYASPDKLAADATCAVLERNGLRCWIAPRDITAGQPWPEAIIEAINGCRAMVLVFSRHSNGSRQMAQEVERAIAKGLAVVPFRIEDAVPSRSMEYFLSTPHWLDAFPPPMEQHLERLAANVRRLIGLDGAPGADAPPDHHLGAPLARAPSSLQKSTPRLAWAALAAGVVAALAGGTAWMLHAPTGGCDDQTATYPEVDGNRLAAFMYRAADINQVDPVRQWSRVKPDLWMEKSAEGTSWLHVARRIHTDSCDGTVVTREDDADVELFLADRNCQPTTLRFRRRPACHWAALGFMQNVE